MAVGTWLSALAALHSRAPVAAAVGAGASVAAAVLWRWHGAAAEPHTADRPRWIGWPRAAGGLGWWRGTAGLGLVLGLLLGVVCGSVATAARLAARDAAPIAGPAAAHASVTAELTVRRDPRPLHDPGAAQRPSWLVPAWLHRLQIDGDADAVRLRVRVLVLTGDPGWESLLPGQRVRATGRLAPPRGGDLTAAVLSATGPPEPLGEPPWPQRAAGSLRVGLRTAVAPLAPEPGGLVPGLAVGDVSRLDPKVADDFLATGMSHLTAVSGANVAIVVGFVALVARAGRAPPWLTAASCGCALAGYVILCRADPSVLRAGAMGAVALLALATGRPRAALPALGATVAGLVILDPQLASEIGFALSVLATAGLLLLAPRWRDALRRRRVPRGVAEAIAVPAAAQLAVAPLIAGYSGTISLVAVAANLAATPAVAPATILGVLAAAVAPLAPPVAEFLAWLASWPAWWLVLVAGYGARVPAAVVPWPAGVTGALLLAALTVAGLLALRHRRVRLLVGVVATAIAIGALPVRIVASGWPPAGAVVVACAVGQGDLLVVPVGAGAGIVFDAGPDPVAADRCLRDLRIRTIPLLVISHFHADHVGGIDGLVRGREVAGILTAAVPEPEFGHDLVTATATSAGVPIRAAQPGSAYRLGPVSLAVLSPPYQLTGTRSDPNNNSLVVMATVHGVRVLLPGDAELELQRELLTQLGSDRLRADVLKVPHHGSSYQASEFLEAVEPAVALVSVGADNSYGHPHSAPLDRLRAGGARVLRTDLDGDVAAVVRDGELAVVTRGPPPALAW
ncbi:MAG TPA: ComEC/Rec2 family competence protein [Natronosporangium sp.]